MLLTCIIARSIDLLEESFIRLPEWNLRSVKISLWSTWTLLRVKDQLLLLEPSCKSFHSTQCFETLHFFLILLLLNLEFVAPRGCKDRQENRHLFSRNICVIDHYIYHYILEKEIWKTIWIILIYGKNDFIEVLKNSIRYRFANNCVRHLKHATMLECSNFLQYYSSYLRFLSFDPIKLFLDLSKFLTNRHFNKITLSLLHISYFFSIYIFYLLHRNFFWMF